jgi:hypothetical protein
VLLGNADFTATSGTTVVLTTAATAGDLVTTISFYVSSVLGAIPATSGAVTTPYILDGAVTQAKLAAGVAGNGPAFNAYAGNSQTAATNTQVKILFANERFDTNNNFASSTFTPTVAGYYNFSAAVCWTLATNNVAIYVSLVKNGTVVATVSTTSTSGTYPGASVSQVIYMNGSTDYVEVYSQQNSGSSTNVAGNLYATGDGTNFSGCLVRAA